ncbi:hypothetical protein D3C85_986900 [compost metagenome]
MGVAFVTEHRVADIDPVLVSTLQHHEVLVAANFRQYHHRNRYCVELFRWDLVAPGTHADAFYVALHVQHGETLRTDKVLVCIDQHAFDDVLFIDVEPIGLAQNRCQCGGAAAEIGFLFDDVAELALTQTLYLLIDECAARKGGH